MSESRLDLLKSSYFLTASGLETTLLFKEALDLQHFAAFHQWNNEKGRECISNFWSSHIALAKRFKLNYILETPTWRANPDWAQKLGYTVDELVSYNVNIVNHIKELRAEHETETTKIILGGMIGPRGDGYVPSDIMTAEQAQAYHSVQIAAFASAGLELAISYTLNYPDEAIGIVRAAKAHNLPIAISFTVETDGKLGCGISISEFIEAVDAATDGGPLFFMINCAHLSHFRGVFEEQKEHNWVKRFLSLSPNASRKSHEELNNSTVLDDGNPEEYGRELKEMKEMFPHLRVFGGCCGTDIRHIERVCHECFSDRLDN